MRNERINKFLGGKRSERKGYSSKVVQGQGKTGLELCGGRGLDKDHKRVDTNALAWKFMLQEKHHLSPSTYILCSEYL